MRKLTALCFMLAAFANTGIFSTSAQACDHHRRIIYSQPSHVIYATPVMNSTPVALTKQVVRTSIVERRPTVTTTVAKQEQIQIIEKLPEVQQGSVVRARVRFAGETTGEVTVRADHLEMHCEILEWSSKHVTFRMPRIEIVSDAEVTMTIFAANGTVVKSVKGLLTTPADFEIERPVTTLTQHASEEPVR